MAGLIWAMENPNCGIVEPDELDYKRVSRSVVRYLGLVVGEYTDWHPRWWSADGCSPRTSTRPTPGSSRTFRVV